MKSTIKHSDFKNCPDCNMGFFFAYIEEIDLWSFALCETCKGANKKAKELIRIDEVPEGYEFTKRGHITNKFLFTKKCKECGVCSGIVEINPPYTIGEKETFTCDVCGGDGDTGFDMGVLGRCKEVCSRCQGSPKLTAEVSSVEVIKKDGYYFNVEWRVVK